MQKTVSIVIPNWNGKELLLKNIPAIIQAGKELGSALQEIIVVDDGSTDGSAECVHTAFPSVTVIALKENIGFHRATNTGFQKSTAEIVILLNSDIEPAPGAFTPLIPHFEDPLLFGVSGRIYSGDKTTFLYGNRGGSFKRGHFFLYEKKEFDDSQSLFVCGGAGAFSREKFLSLGGFDTLFYPFYYEEQDISYRALKRAWHIGYEPASLMYHQVSASIGKKLRAKKIGYISARNNYLFVIKNITDTAYTLQYIVWIPLFLIRDLFSLRFRFWIAFFLALPRLPEALYKRYKEKPHSRISDSTIFARVQGHD
jgi:O-antigen biosynthesis protein